MLTLIDFAWACVHLYVCACLYAIVCLWESEGNLWVGSPLLPCGAGETWVGSGGKHGSKLLSMPNHLTRLMNYSFHI